MNQNQYDGYEPHQQKDPNRVNKTKNLILGIIAFILAYRLGLIGVVFRIVMGIPFEFIALGLILLYFFKRGKKGKPNNQNQPNNYNSNQNYKN